MKLFFNLVGAASALSKMEMEMERMESQAAHANAVSALTGLLQMKERLNQNQTHHHHEHDHDHSHAHKGPDFVAPPPVDENWSVDFSFITSSLDIISNYLSRPENNMRLQTSGTSSNAKQPKVKSFIIISQQRTGSSMLNSLLASHPQIVSIGEYFIDRNQVEHRVKGVPHDRQLANLALAQMKKKMNHGDDVKWLGFKLQENQMKHLRFSEQTGGQEVVIIPHWRRSILRQVISHDAADNLGWKQVTPYKKSVAEQQFRDSIPTVNVQNLKKDIQDRIVQRANITRFYTNRGHTVCPASRYEDWIQSSKTAKSVSSRVLKCLGVPLEKLSTGLQPVHQDKSIEDTVSNYAEIKKALLGSPYEYMLEDKYEDNAELYQALKRTDAIELEAINFLEKKEKEETGSWFGHLQEAAGFGQQPTRRANRIAKGRKKHRDLKRDIAQRASMLRRSASFLDLDQASHEAQRKVSSWFSSAKNSFTNAFNPLKRQDQDDVLGGAFDFSVDYDQ